MNNEHIAQLGHRKLRVYHEALKLVQLVVRERIAHAELRSQAERAAVSCALNIAEGAARSGKARLNHFSIARGSACEAVAAYEIASAIGESVDVAAVQSLGATVAAMLTGFLR